jgi:hypothetical protein
MLSIPETLKWILPVFVAGASTDALAQPSADAPIDSHAARVDAKASPETDAKASPETDETGGASTTPTLLFIPAGALPVWNVKVVTALGMQGPTAADRLAIGRSLGFQPSVGGELGLPAGVTLGAGTAWVGGDASPTPASEGLSPYFQARYHLLGADNGRGFQMGTSLTYKFVGFQGDPGELELALSSQYRETHYEVGLQAVVGKDLASEDADGELHAYALYRVIPQLGLGGAAQVRAGLDVAPDERRYDVAGGAIASFTTATWQVACLGGVTTIGLDPGHVGGLAQVFAAARF